MSTSSSSTSVCSPFVVGNSSSLESSQFVCSPSIAPSLHRVDSISSPESTPQVPSEGGNISTTTDRKGGGGGSGSGSACSRNISSSNTTQEYDAITSSCGTSSVLERSSSGVGGTPVRARRVVGPGAQNKWPGITTLNTLFPSPQPHSPSSPHCSPSLVRKKIFNLSLSCSPSLLSVVITPMNTQEPGPDGGRQRAADRHDLSPLPHFSTGS